ncbi:MAG TPA: DnaJ domain-containing protein [Polyangiaceae bacterium]|nr:DnaJ domain-containing protein [Polyangiaceae bacterium]
MGEERAKVDLSKPTATGDLARTPFTHLLVYCLDRELTGTLVLQSARGRHALFVQAGVPAKASSCEPGALLGQVLVEIGAVTEPMLKRAIEIGKRQKVPLGEVLVRDGVLERVTLRDALRVQLRRRVVQLARLPGDTAFAFYQDVNLLQGWGAPETTPVEPLAAVLGAVRAQPDPERWAATLEPMQGKPLRLHPMTDPGRFSPSERDRGVMQALRRGGVTIAALEAPGGAPRDELYGLLYALTITRHLGVDKAAQRGPVAATRAEQPASEQGAGTTLTAVARVKLRRVVTAPAVEVKALRTPPPDELAEHLHEVMPTPSQPLSSNEARRREVRERAESVAGEDLFAVLGVGRGATPEEVKSAFFAQAKRWHPDRIPSALADVRPLAARVFARLGEAYQTLTDPERRAAYEDSLEAADASGAHESSSRALRAAIEFQKAEGLLARGDFAGAERLALAAADDDGGRPEYRALGLWARAQRPGVGPEGLVAIAADFDELLRAAPDNARALWYRARLLKRMGREGEALADFRRVLAFDPGHAEAAREVQQFERRNTPAPAPAPARPSLGRDLWGRLFKK